MARDTTDDLSQLGAAMREPDDESDALNPRVLYFRRVVRMGQTMAGPNAPSSSIPITRGNVDELKRRWRETARAEHEAAARDEPLPPPTPANSPVGVSPMRDTPDRITAALDPMLIFGRALEYARNYQWDLVDGTPNTTAHANPEHYRPTAERELVFLRRTLETEELFLEVEKQHRASLGRSLPARVTAVFSRRVAVLLKKKGQLSIPSVEAFTEEVFLNFLSLGTQ
jgi:hypothetical protein